jgi:uncharacterized protein
MSRLLRSTPCVGICSTTYGDLICRGCKRFAHEIVAWNAYSDDQRERVWDRLRALRDQATAAFVEIVDASRLRESSMAARIADAADLSPLSVTYELLRRRARDMGSLSEIGVRAIRLDESEPVRVRDAIDLEFHVRSVAYFERSFHVPVDS